MVLSFNSICIISTMKGNPNYRKDPNLKRYNIPGHAHELTFSCYKRKTFLKSKYANHFLADAINKSRERYNFEVWAYVFMPEHVHLLIFPRNEEYAISEILKSIKVSSSKRTVYFLGRKFPGALIHLETGLVKPKHRFWQHGGGYDRNYWEREKIIQQVEYIHNNPVRRGFVENPCEWTWSSAKFWMTGEDGPVLVERDYFPMS